LIACLRKPVVARAGVQTSHAKFPLVRQTNKMHAMAPALLHCHRFDMARDSVALRMFLISCVSRGWKTPTKLALQRFAVRIESCEQLRGQVYAVPLAVSGLSHQVEPPARSLRRHVQANSYNGFSVARSQQQVSEEDDQRRRHHNLT